MSYFDDQMDAWFDNDCQGSIEDAEPDTEPEPAGSRDRDEWRHEAAEQQRLK